VGAQQVASPGVWSFPQRTFAQAVTKQFDQADPSRAASRCGLLLVARRPDTLQQAVLDADSPR